MIHPAHLRRVIRETLQAMGLKYTSEAAVELLMLTAAHEGRVGGYAALWQHRDGEPKGPALGVFQMEPGRWRDTLDRAGNRLRTDLARVSGEHWLLQRTRRGSAAAHYWALVDGPNRMTWDLRYATAFARAAYWMIPESLPAADEVDSLASYWHRHWCRGCKGIIRQAVEHYRQYAAEVPF